MLKKRIFKDSHALLKFVNTTLVTVVSICPSGDRCYVLFYRGEETVVNEAAAKLPELERENEQLRKRVAGLGKTVEQLEMMVQSQQPSGCEVPKNQQKGTLRSIRKDEGETP